MWLLWTFCGQIWPTASQGQLQQGWGMRHLVLNFSWGWTRRTWRLIARTPGWSTSQWFPGSFGWCPSHRRQSLPGFPCHSWHLLSDKSIGATCKNRKNIWKNNINYLAMILSSFYLWHLYWRIDYLNHCVDAGKIFCPPVHTLFIIIFIVSTRGLLRNCIYSNVGSLVKSKFMNNVICNV